MSGELKHIFDKSACLSRRQLRDYINGHMASEECHALEHHLNDCPLCSAAVDGMLVDQEKALETVAGLNTDFLREHFGITTPEVHLNSMSPAAAVAPQVTEAPKIKVKIPRVKANIQPFWRNVSVAAAILVAVVLVWYMRSGQGDTKNAVIAQKLDNDATVPPPQNENVKVDKPVAENAVAANEPPAVASAPAETEVKPAQENAAGVAAAKASGPAQPPKPADKIADAQKAKPDAKVTTLAATAPAAADKKTLQEKTKAAADLKKNDTKTAVAKTVPANKVTQKEEHQAVAQTVTAERKESASRASSAEAAPHNYSNATPTPAHDEKPAAASSGAAGSSSVEQLPTDKLDKGKYFFDKQKWNEALKEYKVEINNSSKARRHTASVMAAKCYIQMGNTKEAERLLKIVVDEGGSEKRPAKKLLESITEKNTDKK